ncbi:MAG: hypothetical protein M1833_000006 [Piccolia ochrophora]|nr:MAG: hypothetical protein M1833_000006 [Piccolia ochrophora]
MAEAGDRPWSDSEKLYLLAEIVKSASIRPDALLRIINAEGIEPRWEDIALPYGRTLRSCQRVFQGLHSPQPFAAFVPSTLPPPGPSQLQFPSSTTTAFNPKKRPLPPKDTSTPPGRILQPRPPAFSPLNGEGGTTFQTSPADDPSQPVRKKRGRPSKAEAEQRAIEAAARGEVYPPRRSPKTTKKPKQPELSSGVAATVEGTLATEGAPIATMIAPVTPSTTNLEGTAAVEQTAGDTGSTGKTKRPRGKERASIAEVEGGDIASDDAAGQRTSGQELLGRLPTEGPAGTEASQDEIPDSEVGSRIQTQSSTTLAPLSGEQKMTKET